MARSTSRSRTLRFRQRAPHPAYPDCRPLWSPGGRVGVFHESELIGQCPVCQVVVSFANASQRDYFQFAFLQMRAFGGNTWIGSFLNSTFYAFFNTFGDGRIALLYRCGDCSTKFLICRACLRPNAAEVGRSFLCDSCGRVMLI
jgi:hypothetical protein